MSFVIFVSFVVSRALDVESDRAHERNGVTPRYGTGLQAVVEMDLAPFEPVFEVHVDGARGEGVGHSGQREIVRRDQAYRAAVDEAAQHAGCAGEPVVRIRSMEELVQ